MKGVGERETDEGREKLKENRVVCVCGALCNKCRKCRERQREGKKEKKRGDARLNLASIF